MLGKHFSQTVCFSRTWRLPDGYFEIISCVCLAHHLSLGRWPASRICRRTECREHEAWKEKLLAAPAVPCTKLSPTLPM